LEDATVTGALLVAVVFLAIVTLGNVLLLFAVIRRLRYLQELVAPAVPLPAVGTTVERFHVETVDGASFNESTLADGPVLVAILSNTCPTCQGLASQLASMNPPSRAPLVLVVADPLHESLTLLQTLAEAGQIAVIGRDHPAMGALGGIAAFPTVLVVAQGKIVSSSTRLNEVLPALSEKAQATAH
jgi:hypothetical protein